MQVEVVTSKIHRVRGTGADFNYIGRVTVDADRMDAVNTICGEKAQIVNNNGERLQTYAIPGLSSSEELALNGAAARKVTVGDIVLGIAYTWMEREQAKSLNPALVFSHAATNLLS